MTVQRHRRSVPIGTVIVLAIGSLVSAAPMLMVAINSLRPNSDIITRPSGLPTSLYVQNYINAWAEASLGQYLVNSLIVTICALVLALAMCMPAAYALGRWAFPGRSVIQLAFLLGLMVTLKIGILPITQMFTQWHLLDTLAGLVLLYAVQATPMTILILSTFYRQLPMSLEEAALIDGAGHGRIFLQVMTPLIRPAVVTSVVLAIGPIWNDFFMPLVLMRTPTKFTIPVGITNFFTTYTADQGLLYAGVIIAIAPVTVFFIFAMRQVVSGLTAGMER